MFRTGTPLGFKKEERVCIWKGDLKFSWTKMKGCEGENYGVQDCWNPGELYAAMHILALVQWRFFSQGWK